jgi:hypothetical protein
VGHAYSALNLRLAFALFGLRMPLIGYPLLVAGMILAVILDRRFAVDLGLICVGVLIVSTTSVYRPGCQFQTGRNRQRVS